MYLFVPVLALLSTIATALPTADLQVRQRGAGGIIFKDKYLKGESTYIPGNNYCTDLNNIFGNFDGKVRSEQVRSGYKCQWYIDYGCPADGVFLDSSKGDLGPTYDFNIHSVRCTPKN